MQKIIPSLWFNMNAEEAIDFYLSVFNDAKILNRSHYTESNQYGKTGSVMTIDFELLGQQFIAINGGAQFPFNNAVSFLIDCKDQKEIDYYWEKLLEGGKPQQCGWLTDKFGLAWQVAPREIDEMLRDKNVGKADAVMAAMMEMIKIDIEKLRDIYQKS